VKRESMCSLPEAERGWEQAQRRASRRAKQWRRRRKDASSQCYAFQMPTSGIQREGTTEHTERTELFFCFSIKKRLCVLCDLCGHFPLPFTFP
jgi:hypothetical protein